jgi:ubiquinol-cytochrome c reductase cytochrome b subunit
MADRNGWFSQRLASRGDITEFMDEKVPGGAKFTYALGSATLLTFLLLAATGIWELFYYVPSTSQAYNSINFMRFQVPFGWLIHGLHFWAANFMVVLVLLHLFQVFVWGAFKKPRELTWILGVFLLLVTLLAVFTGGTLAWDEKGYWAARVGAGLAGSVPIIGDWMRNLVFGSEPMGQLTLSRLFPIHIAIVPLILLVILGVHMVTFRKSGAAGSIKQSDKVGSFWPEQVLMDLVVYSGLLALMIWLSAWVMLPLAGPADPIDATFVARPDWPFLWLFQVLKYLGGSLEWIGFLMIPAIGILLLLAIPWLDRKEDRRPSRRPVSMALFALMVIGISVLTYLGATSQPEPLAAPKGSPPPTPESSIVSTPPVPGPSIASHTIGGADHGKAIFISYCVPCHGAEGKGGVPNPKSADGTVPEVNPMDPEITGEKRPFDVQFFVDNIDAYIQNGSAAEPENEGDTPKYSMPSFGNTYAMTQAQIADVEAYVLQLNGTERATIEKPGVDPKTYAWWTLGGFVIVATVSGVALVGGRKKRR